ncbi:conjugal transfer protein TraR [bacterium]|nr:conjugal transfer protein TraR [bacterium]
MDIIDQATIVTDGVNERAIQRARQAHSEMPVGRPGDCDLCGEWSGRLVEGACAPCRDARGLA